MAYWGYPPSVAELPHGLMAEAPAPVVKETPSVTFEARCDVCGVMATWRTVLVASNEQETHCDCPCEVAA